jgi:predicted lipoprotein with Yx(FWY)xxD motif
MSFRRGYLALLAVPVLAIGLAACGGSSNSDNGSSNASASVPAQTSSGSDTVSTKSIGGVGTVLVDSKGNTLYTNNQDTASKMACTSACQTIWPALMASGGKPTSSDSAVQAKLGVANGQVTFDGKPLYTFVSDSPGQATGNGFQDSFDGTSFTWTAATASGAAPASSSSTSGGSTSSGSMGSSSSSSGGSSGGYSY